MEPSPHRTLARRLGLWSAIAVLIGSTIGSGIFRSPAGIADRLPGPLPLLAVWVAGGLVALCGALTLAEVAGALPYTGGVYVFIREGWGRLPAFLFGWAELVVIRAASIGALSSTFGAYLVRLFAGAPPARAGFATETAFAAALGGYHDRVDPLVHAAAVAAIVVTAAVNYRGVRSGAVVQNLTTIAKYGALLILVLLALAIGLPRTGGYYTPALPAGSVSVGRFGLALISVLWVYDGWADLSFIAGEVRDPSRVLPRALIGGTLAIIAIYALTNLAYLAVMPVADIRRSPLIAADVAQQLLGPGAVALVVATVLVSTFGTLNGTLLTSPRIFFAMADDGLFFRRVAAVHERYGSPYVAITLTALLGIVFVLLRRFEQLADAFVTAIVPFYALGVAAVFPLRRRAAYNPPFRVPGYPVVPALFIAAVAALLVNGIVDPEGRWPTLSVLGLIGLGIPVYYLVVKRRMPRAGTMEEGGLRGTES